MSGYYTRDDAYDNVVVTVAQPLTSGFITGCGALIMRSSAGQFPGTTGSRMNFGFSLKYSKGGKNPLGNVSIMLRSGGRTYLIKSNAITSLSVALPKASFAGKASIVDITNPRRPVVIDSNATLQIALTDNGEPGLNDTLGIQVLNKSGGMWFSSNWNGTKTVEQALGTGGGNLFIR